MKGNLNKIYKSIINPQNIRSQFKNEIEFIDWLKMGSKKDLKATLKVFEKAEMYHECSLIKNEIN